MSIEWKGVFPALTSKFTAEDTLDLPLFEKNLQTQLEAGVNGIVLGGTLGEASVLTTAEKEQLVKFAVTTGTLSAHVVTANFTSCSFSAVVKTLASQCTAQNNSINAGIQLCL